MASLFLRFVCVMATASLFAGCATTPKPVKETLEKPGIIEEDIREEEDAGDRPQDERIPDRSSVQLPARSPAQPEFEDLPGPRPPGLQDRLDYPSQPDYSDQKQPRRFIWRDRENGRKSWKPAPDEEQ